MVAATRARVMRYDELTPDLITLWREHQAAHEDLHGPFFCPEYVSAAAATGEHIRIAVIESAGQVPAFLPYQQDGSQVARPVGLRACDFSGLIAPPGYTWSPTEVIRQCSLAGWDFANVPVSQRSIAPHVRAIDDSPYVDLTEGFDGFVKARARSGSELLRQVGQKIRKFEREVGPVRFELHVDDRQALASLYEWKAAQRARTGTFDVLALPWMRRMLDSILCTDTPTFGGMLSVMYVHDTVAAVHLGMRSDVVFHYWFASYNRELQQYSPGLILLLQMAQHAPTRGIRMLTLGRGDEPYKLRFTSGVTRLGSGSVDCTLSRRLANAMWYAARRASHHSPVMAALAHSVKRGTRRLLQHAHTGQHIWFHLC